jgi:hypothetical protein
MATEAQINFAVDAIIGAGFDAPSWAAFLARMKLEADYRAKEAEIRNEQADAHDDATTHSDTLATLAAELVAIQAEIDALE